MSSRDTDRPTDRIYRTEDGEWFFAQRGDQDAGPFLSHDQAEAALRRFLRNKQARMNGTLPGWYLLKRAFRRTPAAA